MNPSPENGAKIKAIESVLGVALDSYSNVVAECNVVQTPPVFVGYVRFKGDEWALERLRIDLGFGPADTIEAADFLPSPWQWRALEVYPFSWTASLRTPVLACARRFRDGWVVAKQEGPYVYLVVKCSATEGGPS